MIVPQNVYRHELTGLDVLVVRSSNPVHCGIRGKIVGESKNMVRIATGSGVKTVPKSHATFRLTLPSGTMVDVDGTVLLAAPEKRIGLQVK